MTQKNPNNYFEWISDIFRLEIPLNIEIVVESKRNDMFLFVNICWFLFPIFARKRSSFLMLFSCNAFHRFKARLRTWTQIWFMIKNICEKGMDCTASPPLHPLHPLLGLPYLPSLLQWQRWLGWQHRSLLTTHCSHVNGFNLNIKRYFGFGNEILIYFNIKRIYSYGSGLKAWLCLRVFVLALTLAIKSSEQH